MTWTKGYLYVCVRGGIMLVLEVTSASRKITARLVPDPDLIFIIKYHFQYHSRSKSFQNFDNSPLYYSSLQIFIVTEY